MDPELFSSPHCSSLGNHTTTPTRTGISLSRPSLYSQSWHNTWNIYNRCSISISGTDKMRNKWMRVHKMILHLFITTLVLYRIKCRHKHCLLDRNFWGKNHHLRCINNSNILDQQFSNILVSVPIYTLKNFWESQRFCLYRIYLWILIIWEIKTRI